MRICKAIPFLNISKEKTTENCIRLCFFCFLFFALIIKNYNKVLKSSVSPVNSES